MKRLIFAMLSALCINAGAVELEMGLGVSRTQPQPNGTWYQIGFPYTLDLTKTSWYIGVREQVTPDWSMHADYVSFGVLHADAIATTDADYNASTHACNATPCIAQSHFVGSGRSDGIKLAAQWKPEGQGFGLIGGLFLFKPRWHTTVYDWTISRDMVPSTIEHSIKQRWTARPVIGISYTADRWQLRVEQYFNKPYDSTNTGLARGTTMLSVGYSF